MRSLAEGSHVYSVIIYLYVQYPEFLNIGSTDTCFDEYAFILEEIQKVKKSSRKRNTGVNIINPGLVTNVKEQKNYSMPTMLNIDSETTSLEALKSQKL